MLWTWAQSDSAAEWKKDLRPRSLFLRVLRDSFLPLRHEAGPLFLLVTRALVNCELHLGSSGEIHHCL